MCSARLLSFLCYPFLPFLPSLLGFSLSPPPWLYEVQHRRKRIETCLLGQPGKSRRCVRCNGVGGRVDGLRDAWYGRTYRGGSLESGGARICSGAARRCTALCCIVLHCTALHQQAFARLVSAAPSQPLRRRQYPYPISPAPLRCAVRGIPAPPTALHGFPEYCCHVWRCVVKMFTSMVSSLV